MDRTPAHRRVLVDTIPTTAAVRWTAVEAVAAEVEEDAAAAEAVVEVGTTTSARAVVVGRIGNKGRDIKGKEDSSRINNRHRQPRVTNKQPLTNPAASRYEIMKCLMRREGLLQTHTTLVTFKIAAQRVVRRLNT